MSIQSVIQLFLRNMLLDGFEAHEINIPIVYENIKSNNLKATYITEQLLPTSEVAYNAEFVEYAGLYKLTVFSDYGTGLLITDIIDSIKDIFVRGTYIIDSERGLSLCIDNYISGDTLYLRDSDKVQKSVSIKYRVFYN